MIFSIYISHLDKRENSSIPDKSYRKKLKTIKLKINFIDASEI